MKNIPKEIWMQLNDDGFPVDDFNDLEGEVTWCKDQINVNDVRYIVDKRYLEKKKANK